jgi:hypothetical protein
LAQQLLPLKAPALPFDHLHRSLRGAWQQGSESRHRDTEAMCQIPTSRHVIQSTRRREQPSWYGEPKQLGGLQIDDQFDLCRLHLVTITLTPNHGGTRRPRAPDPNAGPVALLRTPRVVEYCFMCLTKQRTITN